MSGSNLSEDSFGQLSVLYGVYRHSAQNEPLANHVQKISTGITHACGAIG